MGPGPSCPGPEEVPRPEGNAMSAETRAAVPKEEGGSGARSAGPAAAYTSCRSTA